jgi:hypothetical protein
MALQLIKDKITGIYKYQEIGKPTTPVIDTSAYDAYTSNQKTTLATGTGATTDIGQQTESILRETPGQVQFNPQTGTIEQKDSEGKKIGVDTITDISTTGAQTEMMETPIEKAARIAAMTGGTGSQTGQVGFDDSLIRRSLDLQERAQKINSITKTADLGLQAYRAYKGIGNVGSVIQGTTGPITPLTGGSFGGSTFMSGAGGAAVAGGLGYGVSKMLGGSPKENRAAGVGSAVGMAVGGPVGGVVGGVIGKVFGCFLPDTLVSMTDGSKKKIIDIELKDNVAIGGFVFATGKFLVNDIYDYKGIKVSGSHLVNEKGNWLRVEDSKISKLISTEDTVVYTLGTKNRRILINDILFTDYFDIDEQQKMAS